MELLDKHSKDAKEKKAKEKKMRLENVIENTKNRHREVWHHEGKYYLYSYENHLHKDKSVPGFEETLVFRSNALGEMTWPQDAIWEDNGWIDSLELMMFEIVDLI